MPACSWAVGALVILLWHVSATQRWISPIFLPPPERAWSALLDGFQRGELLPRLLLTLTHVFWGWLIASIVGITLGALVGTSRIARLYLMPTLEFLRPLPPAALFPLAIVFFGLGEDMVLAVIAFGSIWPPLLSTIHGFSTLPERAFEVRDLLKISRLSFIWKIALPHSMPNIIAGMRLSLTISLVLSVTGEMLSSSEGLGYWIMLQSRSFRTDALFAGVILFGLIGYAAAQLMNLLQSHLLRWRHA
jgi:ABC-type nitrate/sulfonate/bicarbonate transport system permease component